MKYFALYPEPSLHTEFVGEYSDIEAAMEAADKSATSLWVLNESDLRALVDSANREMQYA